MKKITVVIVDDHWPLREELSSMLRETQDIEVLASLASAVEAINLPNSLQPDIFLMDIVLTGMSGIEATRWIKEQNPNTKVIFISKDVNMDFVTAGIKVNVDGYVRKYDDKNLLLTAIRTVMLGEKFFAQEIKTLVFQDYYRQENDVEEETGPKKSGDLTKRENQVLALISLGKSNRQIAEDLSISVKTVETHKSNLQGKLGLTNAAQLVRFASQDKHS